LRRFFAGEGKTVAKLIAYALVCLGVLFYLISLIGNVHLFSHDVTYKATMSDVTGLLRNDNVKVAGVAVGKVTNITTERGKAVVTFKVKRDVHLRTSTQVGVRWRNVLGQKYLYVYPGSSGRVLKSGERLPESQSVSQADVGDFLNAVGPILKAIDPADVNAFVTALMQALQGNEAKVGNLLGNTAAVADTLGSLDTRTARVITNLDQVVGAVAERDSALDQTVSNLASISRTLAQNNDSLQGLVTNFAAVQAQLRQLITEHRGDVDTAVANLQTIANVLGQHRSDLEASLSTLSSGLSPYHLISSYGQWFQVRAVIVCMANQARCDSESVVTDVISPRTASASKPAGPNVGNITGFAVAGRAP
jgi:phospholipid/cholesterol/gamma-HCH transport system substrate-binding protein